MLKIFCSLLLMLMLTVAGCSASSSSNRPADSSKPQTTTQTATNSSATGEHKNISPHAGRIYGRAVHISDGDTIVFQSQNGEKFKVRLYAIDAPEKAQPYGPQSTGILRNLIGQEVINLQIINTDRYGRKVCRIYVNNQDINAEMVKLGAAWHYKYYDKSSDYDRYDQLERNARAGHKGLWNRNNPTPPWEYRKAMREKQNRK